MEQPDDWRTKMSDFIIVNDSYRGVHLEHKRYKYLKREWKNGHWNYTYPHYGEKNAPYQVHTKGHAKTLSDISTGYRKEANKQKEWMKEAYINGQYNKVWFGKDSQQYSQMKDIYNNRKSDYHSANRWAEDYGRLARAERDKANKAEAEYARRMHQEIKKWEKMPSTKILTYINKGKDLVSSLINKWKTKKKSKPRTYTINK